MKKSNYTEEQIAFALKQAELGAPISEVCRKLGIAEQTLYRWKSKHGGKLPSDMKRLRQLEEKNAKLKKPVADLRLGKLILQRFNPLPKSIIVKMKPTTCCLFDVYYHHKWLIIVYNRQKYISNYPQRSAIIRDYYRIIITIFRINTHS